MYALPSPPTRLSFHGLAPMVLTLGLLGGCASPKEEATPVDIEDGVMAVAYSGFREGQHPDRGAGAVLPSLGEIEEDLEILVGEGFELIRLYDCQENSAMVLQVIRDRGLPIKVMLGVWLSAELSNHDRCPWLTSPIPEATLAENRRRNELEVAAAIELASAYPGIVVAINVGNEALVDWTDHLVPVDRVLEYVRRLRAAVPQALTVAENYDWWARHGAVLARELDFVGVHSYALWEGREVEQALAHTQANVDAVRAGLPGARIAILEAGWATTASEFGSRASEDAQARYFEEMGRWAAASGVTVFFFEAFDEPWKGDPGNPAGAEKHWGLFFEDRTPKAALR